MTLNNNKYLLYEKKDTPHRYTVYIKCPISIKKLVFANNTIIEDIIARKEKNLSVKFLIRLNL